MDFQLIVEHQPSADERHARGEIELQPAECIYEIRLGFTPAHEICGQVDVAAADAAEPFERNGVQTALCNGTGVENARPDRVVGLASSARLNIEHTREAISVARREHATEEIRR